MASMARYDKLTHVRGSRIYVRNAVYHLRTSTVNRAPLLADCRCQQVVLEGLTHTAAALDFCILAYVVMPDHVHMVLQPRGAYNISAFMASFKKHSSRKLNRRLGRKGPFWRREFFDHMLRSDEHLHQLIDYIHDNPVRRGLAPSAAEWRFSSWQDAHAAD